jgi:secreted trypsin-like serine protease
MATYPHPNYRGSTDFDLMIVKLDRPVNDPDSNPISMNFDENVPSMTGEELLMLGFGSVTDDVSEPARVATVLQEAPTEYLSFEECAVVKDPTTGISLGNSLTQTQVMGDWFCTILNEPVRYAHCFGDSGGPIIIEGGNPSEDVLVAVIVGYVLSLHIQYVDYQLLFLSVVIDVIFSFSLFVRCCNRQSS